MRFVPRGREDLAPSGERAKVVANLAALRTLRAIQSRAAGGEDGAGTTKERAVREGGAATAGEQVV